MTMGLSYLPNANANLLYPASRLDEAAVWTGQIDILVPHTHRAGACENPKENKAWRVSGGDAPRVHVPITSR